MLNIFRTQSKLFQAFSLGTGFALGQGLYFMANLFLAQAGNYETISRLGILLGLFSLVQWIGDAGGISMLGGLVIRNRLRRHLFVFCTARLIITLQFVVVLYFLYGAFGTRYDGTIWLLLVCTGVVWAANISGLIDYHGLNGRIAFISSLNWSLPSLIAISYSDTASNELVAGAFLLGSTITVLAQWRFLYTAGFVSPKMRFNIIGVFYYSRQIIWYTLAYASAQIYGRLIAVIVSATLNPHVGGIYLFVKNFANFIGQIFVFLRRTSQRELLIKVTQSPYTTKEIFIINKTPLIFIGSISVVSALLYMFILINPKNLDYWVTLEFATAFLMINFIWAVNNIFSNLLVSIGKSKAYAIIVGFSSLTGVYLATSCVSVGLYGVFLVELVVYVLVFLMSLIALKREASK